AACNVISTDDFAGGEGPEQAPPPRTTDGAFGDAGDQGGGGSHGGDRPPAPPPAGDAGDDGGGADAGLTPKSTFVDDFARPDGTTIGNGWLPKTAKWSLSGGSVLEAANNLTYKDLLVQRPASEA